MIHYLNVCDIKGGSVPPVDIITFGSPCQDLSVAGKRAGLKHEANGDDETTRSGLFMEAVRIIKEMKEATNGRYPKWALWENVPGAFSSNKGEDFRIVLEELAKISDQTVSVPTPPGGKWTTSGYMDGDCWSIAWRTVDAKYHGVAQRRRRILLVADLTGQRAGEVSFICEGLPGYPSSSGEAREAAAGNAPGGSGADDSAVGFDGYNGAIERARGLDDVIHIDRESWPSGMGFNRTPGITEDGVSATLQTKGPGAVCYSVGMGGGKSYVHVSEDKSPTLSSGDSHAAAYGIRGSMIGRKEENGPQGDGVNEDVSFTLNTIDRHAVAYGISSYESNAMKSDNPHSGKEVTGCLMASGYDKLGAQEMFSGDYTVLEPVGAGGLDCGQVSHTLISRMSSAVGTTQDNLIVTQPVTYTDVGWWNSLEETAPTLMARQYKDPHLISETDGVHYIVRRLTPTECARLQGFPDWWGQISKKDDFTEDEFNFWNDVYVTHQLIVNNKVVQPKTKPQLLTWYNKLHGDSAEYKMWGNGVALPCVRVPIHNMAKFGAKTLASLFDGSGGFPLAGTLEGITPVWASEIEPYPIAVTVERFPEPDDDWMD